MEKTVQETGGAESNTSVDGSPKRTKRFGSAEGFRWGLFAKSANAGRSSFERFDSSMKGDTSKDSNLKESSFTGGSDLLGRQLTELSPEGAAAIDGSLTQTGASRLASTRTAPSPKMERRLTATGHVLEKRGDKVVERMTSAQATNEIRTLREKLRRQNEELRDIDSKIEERTAKLESLQESRLPVDAARTLTHKALRKGKGLTFLSCLLDTTNLRLAVMREGFTKLCRFTFGSAATLFRKQFGKGPGALTYSDSHLRMFRQEQLILLAENERLTEHLVYLRESCGLKTPDLVARAQLPETASRIESDDQDVVELEANEVSYHLDVAFHALGRASLRAAMTSFRRLSVNAADAKCSGLEKVSIKMGTRRQLFRGGFLKLMVLERLLDRLQIIRFFWLLRVNLRQHRLSSYSCRACESFRQLSIPTRPKQFGWRRDEPKRETVDCSSPDDQAPLESLSHAVIGNTMTTYAYHPHYTHRLPSTSRKRNVYIPMSMPQLREKLRTYDIYPHDPNYPSADAGDDVLFRSDDIFGAWGHRRGARDAMATVLETAERSKNGAQQLLEIPTLFDERQKLNSRLLGKGWSPDDPPLWRSEVAAARTDLLTAVVDQRTSAAPSMPPSS